MTAKAREIAHDITANLKLRQSGLTVTESVDTDGFPLVTIGTAVAGAAGALIKVLPQDWPLAKDILGLTANAYGPHKVQVCLEANPSAGAGADINTDAQLMPILCEAFLRGCRVEIFRSANGTAPVAAQLVSGNLKATIDPHPLFGMIANQ